MDLKKIKAIVEKGGATLDAKTFDDAKVSNGYMVGIKGDVIDVNGAFYDIKAITSSYMLSHIASEKDYIGYWVNDNNLYIDLSQNVLDLDDAITLGKANNQKAIWDVVNNCEITLDF
jgi:hypothetical protein